MVVSVWPCDEDSWDRPQHPLRQWDKVVQWMEERKTKRFYVIFCSDVFLRQ